METIHVSEPQPASPPPSTARSVVLVPYYAAVEKECDDGLRALGQAGVQVRRASFSAIDLLRSVMLSQALRDGFERFLFIDADIGFDPDDALRLLARPEPVAAGIYMKKNAKDYSGAFAAGVDRVVFGPAAPGPYPMLYASAGFLRLRAEVLHRMVRQLEMPLCHWGPVKDIYPFFLPLCVPDGRGGTRYLTEDYSFSHRLGQIGVVPVADTTIKLYHFGRYGFSFEDLVPRQSVLNCTIDINYASGEDRP